MTARKQDHSKQLFDKGCTLIPGGVNSPVRAFGSVGTTPFITSRGEGACLYDADGNRYVDYVQSWGPMILGHANPEVVKAVCDAAGRGTSFGTASRGEVELAAMVTDRMPWIEKLRLVSSGTEACMSAARIARGATGRELIVKFDGCYHGHSDAFLVKAGSGLATGGLPASGGVPEAMTGATISVPYNDADAIHDVFRRKGRKIAAVIVEPVAANMGVVPPALAYLETLRTITREHDALLIFDEVITGFRVAPGGAAEHFTIRPDLVCLGKILGGGMPIGGVGGRADLMDQLAPLGPIYQAGTLSGNPVSVAAGLATLRALNDRSIYVSLNEYADELIGSVTELADKYGIPMKANRVRSLFTFFFSDHEVYDFASAQDTDMKRYGVFFRGLLERGIFIAPSGFEAWFVSTAHGADHRDQTIAAVNQVLKEMAA